ncbi:MAG: NirA family protein [Pseudomonadota bacterium]|nr:NirA family protein [Pseudomonadota bacterium]
MTVNEFTEAQKQFLDGLGRGVAAARAGTAPASAIPAGPERIHAEAQNRVIANGGKLTREEEAKRDRPPLDMWDEVVANAQARAFPKGIDVFRYKFHGLFYVAPAQDAFMCRLRIPNGILSAHKLLAVADLAERYAGGYAHVTTRANLQLREIPAEHSMAILQGLAEAGLTSRGAGADNVRNVTGSPTAGIDPVELIDTRPLGLALHHAILNHRELYGLPRKFNIAFDGGGSVGALEDTNDIGFSAVRIGEGASAGPSIYFRVAVGGITGHGDFARDLGVVVTPEQCVNVATAILRVFIDQGDRTDRTRARLKYVLDAMGLSAFVAAVEEKLGQALPRVLPESCDKRAPQVRGAHAGFHDQAQAGLTYCGVAIPVGRMTVAQMRGLAEIALRFGDGDIRLTVWQNVILSGVSSAGQDEVEAALCEIALTARPGALRAGMVACTGNTGCKFSASDTKRDALAIVEHVESRMTLDTPINVHVTGCPHSCAQHFVGDIGLLATRIAVGEDAEIEGYHVFAGGGFGEARGLGREIVRNVPAADVPATIERLLAAYVASRADPCETFSMFARRTSVDALREHATAVPDALRRAA